MNRKIVAECCCAGDPTCGLCEGTGILEAYECAGHNCDAFVDHAGALCVGCSTRLDNAIDHREFPDRVFFR